PPERKRPQVMRLGRLPDRPRSVGDGNQPYQPHAGARAPAEVEDAHDVARVHAVPAEHNGGRQPERGAQAQDARPEAGPDRPDPRPPPAPGYCFFYHFTPTRRPALPLPDTPLSPF